MISFKEFLAEVGERDSDRRSKIDFLTACNAIEKSCSTALAQARKGHALYRGTKGKQSDFYRYDTTSTNRRSSAVHNFYGTFLDNLPAWKNFPRRQLICSAEKSIAAKYAEKHSGDVVVIFPVNTAKLGVCPTDDVQTSFEDFQTAGYPTLVSFNYACQEVMKLIDVSEADFFNESKTVTVEKLKSSNSKKADGLIDLLDLTESKNLHDALVKALAPTNFKTISVGTYPADREIWMDSQAIVVPCKDTVSLQKFCAKMKLDPDLFSV